MWPHDMCSYSMLCPMATCVYCSVLLAPLLYAGCCGGTTPSIQGSRWSCIILYPIVDLPHRVCHRARQHGNISCHHQQAGFHWQAFFLIPPKHFFPWGKPSEKKIGERSQAHNGVWLQVTPSAIFFHFWQLQINSETRTFPQWSVVTGTLRTVIIFFGTPYFIFP